MRRSLREVVHDLLGRSAATVVARLDAQLETVVEAVAVVRAGCQGDDVGERMDALEREKDDRRAAVTRLLSSSLITPIDREDLFRLARSIGDVLDNLRDFGRELDLYRPPDRPAFLPMLDAVGDTVDVLREGIATLERGPEDVVAAARTAASSAAEIRRRFEDAVGRLLDREVDSGSLRQRELLRRLDVVGLRLGEASNALADGALKRIE